jgi:putrescine transport system substrate-binding protein
LARRGGKDRTSDRLAATARALGVGVLVLLSAACGPAEPTAPSRTLRVYNWSDYIAPDTVARFERETGIRVTYDVFDGNEVLEAKLLSGASGYDLVVPTSEFIGRQILAGVFQPLDRQQLRNYPNLDAELLRFLEKVDPGNAYAVPYLWGTTGIGYNVDKVRAALGPDAPVDSLALVFEPRYLERLKRCGVAYLDAPREVFSTALRYLGLDPDSSDPQLYSGQARALLERARPYITYFNSSQYINDLANGEICVALGWSGDILQAADRAREAGNGVEVSYRIPREGGVIWFDLLAIPADARNVANAHRFIDFLLQPEVIAEVTAYVKYANANRAADELVPAGIRSDAGIYPPAEVRARMFTMGVSPPKVERVMTRAWTGVKTGR